jgi:hypothetical protein
VVREDKEARTSSSDYLVSPQPTVHVPEATGSCTRVLDGCTPTTTPGSPVANARRWIREENPRARPSNFNYWVAIGCDRDSLGRSRHQIRRAMGTIRRV